MAEETETEVEPEAEAEAEAEIQETIVDEDLDEIKPHSDIESDDAGKIIEPELPKVVTPDDAQVQSPEGPLRQVSPTN